MTTVNSTNSASSSSASSSSGTVASNQTLGMNDFISLLTTELKNQDPTAPQDNTAMIAQMAQFSTLSATTAMNTTISGISDKLDSIIAAQQAAAGTGASGSTSGGSSSGSSSSGATA